MIDKFGVIVLAAGKGKRMNSDKLKVMHELRGKPLIDYVVTTIEQLEIKQKPIVVVCNDDLSVQTFLGNRASYAVQTERLGTGHAVSMAESILKDKVKNVIVLYGDMPFITTDSLKKLMQKHLEKNNKLTLMTTIVSDFNEWRINLFDCGRIVRNKIDNKIIKIVEKKDASKEELEIKELNTAFFCFEAEWLWENLKQIKNNNNQNEYYLTDLVGLAVEEGKPLSSVEIANQEALGINTIEHLNIANNL